MFFTEGFDHLAAVFWYYKNQIMNGTTNITETINKLYNAKESQCLLAIAGIAENPYSYYANRIRETKVKMFIIFDNKPLYVT